MSLWWALGSLLGLDGGRRGEEGHGHGLARATGHAGKGAKREPDRLKAELEGSEPGSRLERERRECRVVNERLIRIIRLELSDTRR